MMDDVERLEKRIAFLRAHEKKMERIALIRAVHKEKKLASLNIKKVPCCNGGVKVILGEADIIPPRPEIAPL